MSFFRDAPLFDDAVLIDETPRETVAEGVVLERRSLLRLSAATVAAGMLAACSAPGSRAGSATAGPLAADGDALTGGAPLPDGTLDMVGFLNEMHPRAKAFVASGGQREEAYLMAVGELMTRLQPPAPEQAKADMKAFLQREYAGAPGFDLLVVMFRLDAGQGFDHHDHRDYNGVILGVEGEAHVTNYDILGDSLVPPKGETFTIRQTRDDVILPGRFSTLGTTRENVHELKAGPEGAVVLDVFTYLNADAGSHFLDVAEQPRDAGRRIYEASWR